MVDLSSVVWNLDLVLRIWQSMLEKPIEDSPFQGSVSEALVRETVSLLEELKKIR